MQRIFIVGIVFAVLGLAASALAVPAPVAKYQFEGNFNDTSGNNNHASLTAGNVTFTTNTWQTNPTQAGLWPMNTTPDYLTVANGQVGNCATDPANSALTVAFTVRIDYTAGKGSKYWIVDKIDNAALKGWGVYIETSSNPTGSWRPIFAFYDDEGSYKTYVVGDNAVTNGAWWHLGVVYKYQNGASWARWYMNGAGDDQYPNYDKLLTTAVPALIGTESSSLGGRDMAGVIDCLQIWHQALSDADMTAVYNACKLPEPSTLVLVLLGLCATLRRRR